MTWVLVVAYTAITVRGAWRAAVAAHANLRAYLVVRELPPLVPEEVAGAGPVLWFPRRWPAPSSLSDERLVAAYRDYARERRDAFVEKGELAMLVAGAALGAALPTTLVSGWAYFGGGAAFLLGFAGHRAKQHGLVEWSAVAARYETRRREIRGEVTAAAPAPVAPGSRLLRAWRALRGEEPCDVTVTQRNRR